MRPTRFSIAGALASVVLACALYAGAQTSLPVPIGERMHDLHDQRYQRAPGATVAAPSSGQHHHGTKAATPSSPGHHHHHGAQPAAPATGTSHHGHGGHDHGTPAGWKFTLPPGDAARGRAVFAKFECYACHEVKGQSFPGVKDPATVGPELSEMASHHEAEFFAESIVNPNALIDEPQWKAPDGTSKMPSFNDLLTVQELIDLVAFIKSLAPPAAGGHKH